MKKQLLTGLIILMVISGMAQRVYTPQSMRNKAERKEKAISETMNFNHEVLPSNPISSKSYLVEEEIIGVTRYDLQTNSSMQNRIYHFDDGTMGAVFTYGMDEMVFENRGTGYNYYDGSSWGPLPTTPLESDRSGWPAYAPFGENGEIVVSHYSGAAVDGLAFSYRDNKGMGDWNQFDFFGPTGYEGLLMPRMATGGTDFSVIHLLAVTPPEPYDGMDYQDVDAAILYSRSTDGGLTWAPENILFDEINADFFYVHGMDTYEIQAQGDNVAFLFGDSFVDLTLMKSTDGGDNWEKTTIWECPYPWDPNNTYPTDTFYCSDGAHALAFDPDGKVHVAFGINRTYSDGAGIYWFPLVDGLAYWNEDRPTFSNDLNALNPYGDPASELIENYSLIGWSQDLNGNGEWDILGDVGTYYVGVSSMPSITVDEQYRVYVVYSSITEEFDNGIQDYRHLWARTSPNNGDWWSMFFNLNHDILHLFDECIFPSFSQTSDDYLYLNYQLDTEPGLAVRGDLDPYGDNDIRFMKIDKYGVGIKKNAAILNSDISQNQPNPFNGTSTVSVNVRQASNLSMEVSNMMGQVVYTYNAGQVTPGMNTMTIDGSSLSKGVYFYTVRAGEAAITKKMIIE